ncbi:hypothetical protein [Ornithinimicrobium sediminis]|uniref:hypothetical protein n=1 Tax=Ornithinimicrobium sediminis TaxID=2904603 RepID=UPI001E5BDDA2|nr:hypothetical protein [Ornithinimicrobium sediminis]MCE0485962.1 hypothetical protein [Ornithinimicrobium sediminis]
MELLPGVLILVMSVAYLTSEVVLRRRSSWERGPLNWATRPIALVPLAIYALAVAGFAQADLALFNLTSILIVLLLPITLGASYRAFRPDGPEWVPPTLAAALSLFALFAIWLGAQG